MHVYTSERWMGFAYVHVLVWGPIYVNNCVHVMYVRMLKARMHISESSTCKRTRWRLYQENLLLVKMKEQNLLKIQPLPTLLRMQAIRSKQLRNIYICYIHAYWAALAWHHCECPALRYSSVPCPSLRWSILRATSSFVCCPSSLEARQNDICDHLAAYIAHVRNRIVMWKHRCHSHCACELLVPCCMMHCPATHSRCPAVVATLMFAVMNDVWYWHVCICRIVTFTFAVIFACMHVCMYVCMYVCI